jgi:hypothetical protein
MKKKMTFKNWVFAISATMVIVSAALKIFHVTKWTDILLYIGVALVFLTLAFERAKKTENKNSGKTMLNQKTTKNEEKNDI